MIGDDTVARRDCRLTADLRGNVYVTVNCGNQALPAMPEIFRQYWECL